VIDAVILAAQFTGLAVFAIAAGVLVFGLYGWALWLHRRGIDRGWWS
jgi:hypothetical protein